MTSFNRTPGKPCRVLASDLDGTLIPLPDSPDNDDALAVLREARSSRPFKLIYATGRHYESVREVMVGKRLPEPDWIVCDVGTSIYQSTAGRFEIFEAYRDHLDDLTGCIRRNEIESVLADTEGMQLQPPAHQQTFKISYACARIETEGVVAAVTETLKHAGLPFHVIGSIDPFHDRGLIDVLPDGISKAYALIWLATHADFEPDEVVYCGDSGNDLAALTCGFHAVIVANASEELAGQVQERLRAQEQPDLYFHASGAATSGVLEGCRHFGLVD